VAYLVRSFQTNARIRSLTTGTFNRIVKDRIAFRTGRRAFSPVRIHLCRSKPTGVNPTVPETLQTYRAAQNPVNATNPQNFHVFSTTGRTTENRPTGRYQPGGRTPGSTTWEGHDFSHADQAGTQIGTLAPEGQNRTQRYGLPHGA
jgi:hypothetical protein